MSPKVQTGSLEAGALDIVRRLVEHGHRALWAGGCVRDRLLGREAKDIDIATDAVPEEVIALFQTTLEIGKAFGVIAVRSGERFYDVATFRRDEGGMDGRHPDRVRFTEEREDAQRRDFTVNALFYDPLRDELLDYVEGRKDLDRRLIRAVGEPRVRFREDHLRMVRAVRFASTLDFSLDAETADAIRERAGDITHISVERIYSELNRLWTESARAGEGLRLLRATGLLAVLLPEVHAMSGVEQPPQFHPEGDVFTHTAIMLDALPASPDPVLAWAVLLHDVGKPPTAEWSAGPKSEARWRFNEHDQVGAEISKTILRRLKAPSRMVESVEHCIRNHMRFGHADQMRESTVRRLVGHPLFPLELELHRLDCECSHGDLRHVQFLREILDRLRAEPVLPEPRIRGEDILSLSVPKGPEVGRWLRTVYDRQLEHPEATREDLLTWLRAERVREPASSSFPSGPLPVILNPHEPYAGDCPDV